MNYHLANQLVKGAQKSINRTLWVYGIIVILFFSIMAVLWNLYLSWVNNIFEHIKNINSLTIPQQDLFKLWTSSTFFSLPIININLQISDASVIISFAFFILTVWLFFSTRRENHIIGKTLRLSLNENNEMKKFIYYGISFSTLFSTITDRDKPIDTLEYKEEREKSKKYVRDIVRFVFFAPSIAIIVIISFDLYSLFSTASLFRGDSHIYLYKLLTFWDYVKVIFMEVFALVIAIFCGFLNQNSWQFEKMTNKLLKDFASNHIKWE